MDIGVVGVNFKTTSLAFRESFAESIHFLDQERFSFVVVSTCNRVEIYFSGESLVKLHSFLLAHVQKMVPLELLYSYFSYDCFLHLAKVASGLDSARFFESEIQRQIKKSYQASMEKRTLSGVMHYVFQKSLHVGKELRSLYSHRKRPSLEKTLWDVVKKPFASPEELSILFVGFSQTNRQIFDYFRRKGVEKIAFSSRNPSALQSFSKEKNIRIVPWKEQLSFEGFSVIMVASNQTKLSLEKSERCKPAFIFDLSVPRVVEYKEQNPEVVFHNMEDIDQYFLQGKEEENALKHLCEQSVKKRVYRLSRIYEQKRLSKIRMTWESRERNHIPNIFHPCNELN